MKADRRCEVKIVLSLCMMLMSMQKLPASEGRCVFKPQHAQVPPGCPHGQTRLLGLGPAVITEVQGKPMGTAVVQQVFRKALQDAEPVCAEKDLWRMVVCWVSWWWLVF